MNLELLGRILAIAAEVIILLLENPKLGINQTISRASKKSGIPASMILSFVRRKI